MVLLRSQEYTSKPYKATGAHGHKRKRSSNDEYDEMRCKPDFGAAVVRFNVSHRAAT